MRGRHVRRRENGFSPALPCLACGDKADVVRPMARRPGATGKGSPAMVVAPATRATYLGGVGFVRFGLPSRLSTSAEPGVRFPRISIRSSDPSGGNPRKGTIGMPTGTVKWFNATKGYGFIQPDDSSKDVFLHISDVQRAGLDSPQEGEKLSFDVQAGQNGKSSACNLKRI